MIELPPPLGERLRADPIRLVDVGARGGWPQGWGPYRRYVSLIGFEPDQDECRQLRERAAGNEIYLNKALYRRAGPVTLHHYEQRSWTSLYKPNDELLRRLWPEAKDLRIIRSEEIDAVPLDEALSETGIDHVDFIKLDTQGSELDILLGAERTLACHVVGVEVEVEFIPIYDRQPLFAEVDAHLRSRGYDFVDFSTLHHHADVAFDLRGSRGYESIAEFFSAWFGKLSARSGALRGGKQLVYGDAVYLRRQDDLVPALQNANRDVGAHIVKSAVACVAMAYFDHAKRLAELGIEGSWLSAPEGDALLGWIERSSRAWRRLRQDMSRIKKRLFRHLEHQRG